MSARLWTLSDLHMESVRYPDAFRPRTPGFDVLVCAGDVFEGDVERSVAKVAALADGKPAVMVLGNHEYWGFTLDGTVELARRAGERMGVSVLERGEVVHAGVRFAGVTLWTDLRLGVAPKSLIRRDGAVVFSDTLRHREAECGEPILAPGRPVPERAGTLLDRHVGDAYWLGSLEPGTVEEPLVIVTHHAPAIEALRPRDRTGGRASMSASDLGWLVDGSGACAWIHGHVHHSLDLVRAGGTRMVCNPGGLGLGNPDFDESLVVEVAPRPALTPP